MTDLISREAAIAWHIERRDEAKANAYRCRSTDEETACLYIEEAILHSEAINALRALPAQAPAVKVDKEALARQVYASMVFANQLDRASEKEAAWVEGGNSIAQQEARACAARILAAIEPACS